MTPIEYKKQRLIRNLTLPELAERLRLHWTTISRRERGELTVTHEAEAAIRALPINQEPTARCWRCRLVRPLQEFKETRKRFGLVFGRCDECRKSASWHSDEERFR